jgi:hypothetical protein
MITACADVACLHVHGRVSMAIISCDYTPAKRARTARPPGGEKRLFAFFFAYSRSAIFSLGSA